MNFLYICNKLIFLTEKDGKILCYSKEKSFIGSATVFYKYYIIVQYNENVEFKDYTPREKSA